MDMKAKALKHPIVLVIIALLLTSCFSSRNMYSQGYDDYELYEDKYYANNNGNINFNVFYNELRPHGRWINNHNYGRVWIPNAGRDFHPYSSNGYWVMTDYGNTWVSNYSWGWAPFHYGRWYFDDYYGWAWIPGYEWAPAWVTWRSGGGYYGWAPMGPGININININLPGRYWTFLPHNRMYHRSMHKYYKRYSPAIYNRTTIINNTYIYNDNRYYSGPTTSEYERTTGRRTAVHKLESTNNRSARSTRVSNNAVSIYRPESGSTRNSSNRSATTVDQSTRSSSSNRNTTVTPTTRSSSSNRNTTVTPTTRSSSSNRNSTVTPTTRSSSSNRNTTVTPTTRSSSSNRNTTVTPTTRSSSSNRNTAVTPTTRSSSSNRNTTVNQSTTNNRSSTTVRSSSTNTNNNNNRSSSSTNSNRNSSTRSSTERR